MTTKPISCSANKPWRVTRSLNMTPSSSPTPSGWHWGSALAGLFIGAIVVSAGLFLVRQPPAEPIVIHTEPPVEDSMRQPEATPFTLEPMPTPTPSEVVVFVSGAVNAPGNYRLPPGARVGDALNAAGGFTADAQTDAINLAAPIHDGEQIDFPTQDEPIPTPTPTPPPTATPAPVDGNTPTSTSSGLININTATQAELETLPGIGPAKAAAIIAGRPYGSVNELLRVSGIGDKTLADLRPLVTVE